MAHELRQYIEQEICPIGDLCAASLGDSATPCRPNTPLASLPFAEDLCIQALALASSRREEDTPVWRFATASADLELSLRSENIQESALALERAKLGIKSAAADSDLSLDVYPHVMAMDITMPFFECRQAERDPTKDELERVHRGYGDFLNLVRTSDKYIGIDVGSRTGAEMLGIFGCFLSRDEDPDDVAFVASCREHITGRPAMGHHSFYSIRDTQKVPLRPRKRLSYHERNLDNRSTSVLTISYFDLVQDAARIVSSRGADIPPPNELVSSIPTSLIAEAQGQTVDSDDAAVIAVMGRLLKQKIDAFEPESTRESVDSDQNVLPEYL